MAWFKGHWVTLFLVLMLIVGLCMLLYPSFSNYWNNIHQSRVIMTYSESVSQLTEEEFKQLITGAEQYNQKLAKSGMLWTLTDSQRAAYNAQLNFDGTGIMGYIVIPKINIRLPIYHGTSDEVLTSSIGHLEGTSLPVGGPSTHCVLSGHRGLPSARLFTDIDQLLEGDIFTITVLNETLTYEVDQIRIVVPEDLSDVQIVPGKDYCTLVTCTPYGINTHRLLVRGHRIANLNGNAMVIADAIQVEPRYIIPFVSAAFLVILLIVLFTRSKHDAEKEKNSAFRKYMRKHNLSSPFEEKYRGLEEVIRQKNSS